MARSAMLVLTLSIATVLTVACGGGSTNTNANANASAPTTAAKNANTTPSTNANTSNANTSDASNSPTAVFKAFYEASKNGDEEAFKKTVSKETLTMLEEGAKEKKKTLSQALKESDVPPTMPELRNEKIDGDKATIEAKDARTDTWETFKFVKEDGRWKVVIDR